MKEPKHQSEVGDWIYESGRVILDTRSPGEFAKGHIPGAVPMPIFEDDERAVIGTLYKQQGKPAAVEKGLEFVGPKMGELVRLARELHEAQETEAPIIVHCWRGGMRSGAVAWLLETAGLPVVKLIGGYKAYRGWAREDFGSISCLRVVGGMTGVGKTKVLHALQGIGAQVLDLEGIAAHLGSAFGNLERIPQPTSEQFANDCHHGLKGFDWNLPIWTENESRAIGTVHLPQECVDSMRSSPVWTLERTQEERLDVLCEVYGSASTHLLVAAFERIREKLGGLRCQEAIAALENDDLRTAAAIGLIYYDKLYDHTQQRYPREHNFAFDGKGISHLDIAEQLHALD